MDRAMCLRHLAQAEQHIELSEKHIAEQEERIAMHEIRGRDSTLARQLLDTFYLAHAQHIAFREVILKELDL